ncbi:MAG TPA: nicotinate-nucleotide adenylyltransferase [Pirellulales bacterium]|jgi:nicotinate-nucleotide adenylyltransferase|nr:nicotinate-nucleotide adenylyltransferase [Pirellulales bacterium]
MRLGIFGGSFNPVHYGHLLLAESCREQLGLEQVWFVPAAIPPHKKEADLAPAAARLDMLELAIGGHTAFAISRYEIDRGGVNYTAETLAHFHQEDPSREMYLLLGADSLVDLPNWKDPHIICQLSTPIAVERSLGSADDKDDAPPDVSVLEPWVSPERLAQIQSHQVRMPRIDLSARDIRGRVAAGESIRYRTPRAVEKYIEAHGLYRAK